LCNEMVKEQPPHLEMGVPSFSQVCPCAVFTLKCFTLT
jgi:hypothetical protein